MFKRMASVLLVQALVGTAGASYMAAPQNTAGQKSLVDGLLRIVAEGPGVVAENLSGDYANSMQSHLEHLGHALGSAKDGPDAIDLSLDVQSIQDKARSAIHSLEGLAEQTSGGELAGAKNADTLAKGSKGKREASGAGPKPRENWVGSESTVLMVETAQGPQVRWKAAPQVGMAPEESLRDVLVGAARDSLRDEKLYAAHGGSSAHGKPQRITIVGEGKDVKITVKVE